MREKPHVSPQTARAGRELQGAGTDGKLSGVDGLRWLSRNYKRAQESESPPLRIILAGPWRRCGEERPRRARQRPHVSPQTARAGRELQAANTDDTLGRGAGCRETEKPQRFLRAKPLRYKPKDRARLESRPPRQAPQKPHVSPQRARAGRELQGADTDGKLSGGDGLRGLSRNYKRA
jgi:hypothetical protein